MFFAFKKTLVLQYNGFFRRFTSTQIVTDTR